MNKTYDPKQVEQKWYTYWEENGFFHQDVDKTKEAFCVVIPPPNVTGQLHMGHALDNTYQDIFVRWKRMQGFNTVWIPGTDHAGIATQARVEGHIRATEGKTRDDLGRDEFLKRTWAWKTMVIRFSTNSRSWELPWIGKGSALLWTKGAPGLCGRFLSACSKRA